MKLDRGPVKVLETQPDPGPDRKRQCFSTLGVRMSVRILALVGSLRAGSHNRQLAEAAVKLAPEGAEVVLFEGLADIPFYNEDIDVEGSVPAAATKLREAALAS